MVTKYSELYNLLRISLETEDKEVFNCIYPAIKVSWESMKKELKDKEYNLNNSPIDNTTEVNASDIPRSV